MDCWIRPHHINLGRYDVLLKVENMQPNTRSQPIFTGAPQVQAQPIHQQPQSPYQEQPQIAGIPQANSMSPHQIIVGNKNESNGPAVASLVFALISIPSTFFGMWIDICLVTSGLALICVIILGIVGLTKNKRQHGGTVVAIIGLIVAAIQIVILVLARMEGN